MYTLNKYGEATGKRILKDGAVWDKYFPKAIGETFTVKKDAGLQDTLKLIPVVVKKTLSHTNQIAEKLRGSSIPQTCSKIWHFVYQHIQYKKDEKGYEQIRSPRRTWHDRKMGVDCDCYSVFISSILVNLNIPHFFRITKYLQDHFQHIYVVVPYLNQYILIDCVTDWFNYEVKYTAKIDYPMDLQFLDGISGSDMEGFDGDFSELNSLDDYARTAASPSGPASPSSPGMGELNGKKKGFLRKLSLKKVLNVVNKLNPATVLLRNGVLAAMKLNIMNVAKRLRWSYLTPEQAAAKGIDPGKFQGLVSARQKLEKIFYGAGGKTDNLRKAMLKGKGNKDKAVQGLDGLADNDFAGIDQMNVYTPLQQLLGKEIYDSENLNGVDGSDLVEGLGDLGEAVSMASVGAALGVLKAIVASLKKLGSIFKNKGAAGSEDFDENVNQAAENNEPVKDTTPLPANISPPVSNYSLPSPAANISIPPPASDENNSIVVNPNNTNRQVQTNTTTADSDMISSDLPSKEQGKDGKTKEGFWEKNKKWLKPTLIGAGGLLIVFVGYKLMKQNKSPTSAGNLNGTMKKKKGKSHRHQRIQSLPFE